MFTFFEEGGEFSRREEGGVRKENRLEAKERLGAERRN